MYALDEHTVGVNAERALDGAAAHERSVHGGACADSVQAGVVPVMLRPEAMVCPSAITSLISGHVSFS